MANGAGAPPPSRGASPRPLRRLRQKHCGQSESDLDFLGGKGGLRTAPRPRCVPPTVAILEPVERCLCGHDEARRKRNRRATGAGDGMFLENLTLVNVNSSPAEELVWGSASPRMWQRPSSCGASVSPSPASHNRARCPESIPPDWSNERGASFSDRYLGRKAPRFGRSSYGGEICMHSLYIDNNSSALR